MKPSFERNPPSEVLIEIVETLNDDMRKRAAKVTGYDPMSRAYVDRDARAAFDAVISILIVRYETCGGDYSSIVFLDTPIWDTEDGDDRKVNEEAPGFNYTTDLLTHLQAKINGISKVLAAVCK